MSGIFNPNEPGIESTDNEAIAKAHGLTYRDDEQGGVYRKPDEDAGEGPNAEWLKRDDEQQDGDSDLPEGVTPGSPAAQPLQPGEDQAAAVGHLGDPNVPAGIGVQELGGTERPIAEGDGGTSPALRDADEDDRGREPATEQTDAEYEANRADELQAELGERNDEQNDERTDDELDQLADEDAAAAEDDDQR